MRTFRRHPLGWGVTFSLLGFALLFFVPAPMQFGEVVGEGLRRVVLSGAAFGMIALLGGGRVLVPRLDGVGQALRMGAWPICVSLVVCLLDLASYLGMVSEGLATVSNGWLANLLGAAFLCLFVGIYEEAIMRVLLLNGLLSKLGGSRNGVLQAVLASSLVFGVVHVLPAGSGIDALVLAQMLLKSLQAACIGMLLGSVFLRTHSFYGTALVHAACDLLLFVPAAFFDEGSMMQVEYVGTSGEDAVAYIIVYLVALAVYAPAVVISLRLVDGMSAPDFGCFVDGWVASGGRGLVGAAAGAHGFAPRPDGLVAGGRPVTGAATDVAGYAEDGHIRPHYPYE